MHDYEPELRDAWVVHADEGVWLTHLRLDELEQLTQRATQACVPRRWQIPWLLARGKTAIQVAKVAGYSAYWIGRPPRHYN